MTDANQAGDLTKKTYHKRATGKAYETVKKHSQENELKLFGSCFWYVESWEGVFLQVLNSV